MHSGLMEASGCSAFGATGANSAPFVILNVAGNPFRCRFRDTAPPPDTASANQDCSVGTPAGDPTERRICKCE